MKKQQTGNRIKDSRMVLAERLQGHRYGEQDQIAY